LFGKGLKKHHFNSFYLLGGDALAYSINDTTLVGRGRTDVHNETAPSACPDVLGDPDYQTFGIDVYSKDSALYFDFYTNFDGYDNAGGVDITLADLALDLDVDGVYEYGVDLTSDANGNLSSSGVYSVSNWNTSLNSLEEKSPSGAWWYGEFMLLSNNQDVNTRYTNPIVDVVSVDDPLGPALLSLDRGNNEAFYKYTLSFDKSILSSNLGTEIGVFWGTAICGNDVIEGKASLPAPVPEPATMLLLGTGLIGMAGLGRKKFQKSS